MIKGIEMRKKDFIYFASAAVLLAASVQVAHADEVGEKESAVTESEAVTTQASSVPVVEEKQEVGTHQYVAPAPVTELPVTSSEVTKEDAPQVETKPISAGESVPSSESAAKPVTGTTTFYSAGSKAPAGRTVSTLSRPQGDLSIENNNEVTGTFDAVVRNVVSPTDLKEVLVPSWSVVGGQDDLIWHKAVRQADGSYRATIKASEHKNTLGQYQVHVHYLDQNDRRRYVTETVVEVQKTSPTGTIVIQNNNKDTGTFDVIIKDVYSPKGVRTIQVPTWSDKDGQDDLAWYEAIRQSDGTYKVSVQASNHKNSTGTYHVHLYYVQNDNSRAGIGATTVQVENRKANTKTQALIKNVNSEKGTYTVTVYQAPQGRQIKQIRVAVWSQPHQENLRWYSTTPSGLQTDIEILALNHGNVAGDYTTHVYVDYSDDSVEGLNLGKTKLSPRNQKVTSQKTYYSQRDPRWGGKWYGVSNMDQSGCVPTSLAMTFTDILGRQVLPTTVADYLYYNTNSFNKIAVAGTDADGLVAATNHWGLKSQMLTGKDAIAATLVSGKHVLAAVEESIFINAPYTHEIVLQGYDNGKTYVRDPFNPANNGWHSIDYIFSVKSTDPIDAKLGSPFFSIFA